MRYCKHCRMRPPGRARTSWWTHRRRELLDRPTRALPGAVRVDLAVAAA